MAVPRKFVSRLIIFSDKGYFEIVLFSTSISIGYHASTLNFLACIANLNVHIEKNRINHITFFPTNRSKVL